MITKMKKLTFLVYHKEYEEFLNSLRELGVVHIVEKQQGAADNTELQENIRLSNRLTATLKLLQNQKHEKDAVIATEGGTAARGLQVLDEVDALQIEHGKLSQQLQGYAKEKEALQAWGNFDPAGVRKLKDAGYVKNITAYYRKKLDAVLSRRPEYRRASAGRSTYTFEPVAEKSFNRGFTTFLLEGRTADITAFNTPKSLGEPVGMVKEIKGNSFTVAGLKQLNNGDGLVFFNRKGELEGFRVNRVEANRVFPLDMPQLTPKTPLYRNFDQAFDKLLAKPSAERKLSVEIEFLDNPFGFTLCMEDETGARIMLTEPFAKELARREQQDNIRTQLSKLGNTPFEASKVVVGLSENWFVPSSLLADMRRRGVEKLLEARRARYPRETVKRVQPSVSIPFPERQLTYLGNVANGKARSFYQDHGVEQIDPAFELSPRKDVPLMFTKHCLRYSMGWCPTYQKDKSPYKEPYYLLYKDTRLRLQFDCKHCQMLVFES